MSFQPRLKSKINDNYKENMNINKDNTAIFHINGAIDNDDIQIVNDNDEVVLSDGIHVVRNKYLAEILRGEEITRRINQNKSSPNCQNVHDGMYDI